MVQVKCYEFTSGQFADTYVKYRVCRDWLRDNVGTEGVDWFWELTGSGFKTGIVRFPHLESDMLTVFKLKFGI